MDEQEPSFEEYEEDMGHIKTFIVLMAEGKRDEAAEKISDWIEEEESDADEGGSRKVSVRGLFRFHLLADASLLFARSLVKNRNSDEDGFWAMETHDPKNIGFHRFAMLQALSRYLNYEEEVAKDILIAHRETHGLEGLLALGLEGISLAGTLLSQEISNGKLW